MSTIKIPVRTVYDSLNAAIGLAEFQTGEVVAIAQGGTSGNTVAEAKLNLTLTDSNIRSLFSITGSGSYDNATGIITISSSSVGGATGTISNVQLASSITTSGLLTTANVVELTNLYYTNARVYSNVTQIGYATNSNVALKANVVDLTTANVTELNSLYFTDARVYSNVTQLGYATTTYVSTQLANLVASAPTSLDTLNELAAALGNDNNFSATVISLIGTKANTASLTTANVIELNNLYFTDARARQAISTSGCTLSYSNTTGIISFSQGNTDTINEGSTNLYYTDARVYSAVTGNLALKANLTDKLNVFGSTSSSELRGIISDETGTGSLVFNASPTFTGTVTVAELSATGNITSPYFYSESDANLKKDVTPIIGALSSVQALNGVNFTWKHNDIKAIGLIAQEVEQVLPVVVGVSPEGYKTVQYNSIIAVLIEAVKDQQKQIDELRLKLNI